MTEGIDVAKYQVANYSTKGLDFVFVKATEGSSYINPKHAAQVATARAHGLVVGHYHFARPGSMSAQADYFLEHAGAKAGDVLACDWEDTGVTGADKDAWLRHVQAKAPGHRVVLYCNRDFWLHRDSTSFCADGLWIADPSAPKGLPRIEADWLFHQYSSAGGLDRNTTRLTADQLAAWAAGTKKEDDMADWNTPLTLKKGSVWGSEKEDQTFTAEAWLTNANGKAGKTYDLVKALSAKVDALGAKVSAPPTIDYAKLAAALIAAVKES